MIRLKDNLWVIPYPDGYYAYEGSDIITMEAYREAAGGGDDDGVKQTRREH